MVEHDKLLQDDSEVGRELNFFKEAVSVLDKTLIYNQSRLYKCLRSY